MTTDEEKSIENEIYAIYKRIGIDRPDNHEEIKNFVLQDVKECADPVDWHFGDVHIAFRRFLEMPKAI